ncbi:MAG TPA: hypothetical protein DEH78_13620 [Solibacterales bacterium]|nr:hypothetical protein [Bryobacterales bacterium]
MKKPPAALRLQERIDAGRAALAAGRLPEAAVHWAAALRSAQRLRVDETLRATLRNNLASVYHSLGETSKARKYYQQALEAAAARHGNESVQAATIATNLAELLRASGEAPEAERLYRAAIAVVNKAVGGSHPQLGTLLNNLAECLRTLNRPEEAEPHYRHALAIFEASLGPNHPQVAAVLNNLAALEADRGSFAAAEALYARALTILGPLQPHAAPVMINYAVVLRKHAAALEAQAKSFPPQRTA